jgi:hypothetical protein
MEWDDLWDEEVMLTLHDFIVIEGWIGKEEQHLFAAESMHWWGAKKHWAAKNIGINVAIKII